MPPKRKGKSKQKSSQLSTFDRDSTPAPASSPAQPIPVIDLPPTDPVPLTSDPTLSYIIRRYKVGDLPRLITLMAADLSEPYNVFTYRHFLEGHPDLTYVLELVPSDPSVPPVTPLPESTVIGGIVCQLGTDLEGYIGMLAVEKSFRGNKLGQALVIHVLRVLRQKGCKDVRLETEISNIAALKLYQYLGFVKMRYLTRHYMNGNDAYQLRLPLAQRYSLQDSFAALASSMTSGGAMPNFEAMAHLKDSLGSMFETGMFQMPDLDRGSANGTPADASESARATVEELD